MTAKPKPRKPLSRKRKSAVAVVLPTPKQQAAALVRFQEQLAQENADLLREGYAAGLAVVVNKLKGGDEKAFDKLLSLVDRAEARSVGDSRAAATLDGAGDSSATAAYTLEELTQTYRRRISAGETK